MVSEDELPTQAAVPTIKRFTKSTLRRPAKLAWPLIERASALSSQWAFQRGGCAIAQFSTWNTTLDSALEALQPPPGCTMDQYKNLVLPTEQIKRHYLMSDADGPTAVVSLRYRNGFWEPVSYQALTGFIAPARSAPDLARALRALGINIRIDAGLEFDSIKLKPDTWRSYDFARIDLRSDYKAHWNLNKKKHKRHITRAEKKCGHMRVVFNDKAHIAWVVQTWRETWAHSSANEVSAATDRLRFWNSLNTEPTRNNELCVQVCMLFEGETPVAGTVNTVMGDVITGQCIATNPDYRKYGAGTYLDYASLERFAADGYRYFDLGGGGGYKELWGPVGGERYGACFRPKIYRKLDWVHQV